MPGHLLRNPWLGTCVPGEAQGRAQLVRLQGQARHRGARPVGRSDQGLVTQEHVHHHAQQQEAPGAADHGLQDVDQSPGLENALLREETNRGLRLPQAPAIPGVLSCGFILGPGAGGAHCAGRGVASIRGGFSLVLHALSRGDALQCHQAVGERTHGLWASALAPRCGELREEVLDALLVGVRQGVEDLVRHEVVKETVQVLHLRDDLLWGHARVGCRLTGVHRPRLHQWHARLLESVALGTLLHLTHNVELARLRAIGRSHKVQHMREGGGATPAGGPPGVADGLLDLQGVAQVVWQDHLEDAQLVADLADVGTKDANPCEDHHHDAEVHVKVQGHAHSGKEH
mmetsp:Transcript_136730/g.323952  ORF Transcript_136730/g.323952 Transcript_136730/m.323952 type:complete len:344 (-) Transcript_136730:1084-2115(-)